MLARKLVGEHKKEALLIEGKKQLARNAAPSATLFQQPVNPQVETKKIKNKRIAVQNAAIRQRASARVVAPAENVSVPVVVGDLKGVVAVIESAKTATYKVKKPNELKNNAGILSGNLNDINPKPVCAPETSTITSKVKKNVSNDDKVKIQNALSYDIAKIIFDFVLQYINSRIVSDETEGKQNNCLKLNRGFFKTNRNAHITNEKVNSAVTLEAEILKAFVDNKDNSDAALIAVKIALIKGQEFNDKLNRMYGGFSKGDYGKCLEKCLSIVKEVKLPLAPTPAAK
ncbi:MAG: hypothetical protein NTZ67_00885 [Gammaproteobacteria bacterium]|nr:hypothetical protein [Gammaproteobacteria bacterium]